MSLGSAIKKIRRDRGLKQVELAQLVGISNNSICQIEVDHHWPQKQTLLAICEKLNVSMAYLLIMTVEPDEIPEEKRELVDLLLQPLKKYLAT